jgi:hypothetical protein
MAMAAAPVPEAPRPPPRPSVVANPSSARRPLLPWLVVILALHGKKLHERRGRRRKP